MFRLKQYFYVLLVFELKSKCFYDLTQNSQFSRPLVTSVLLSACRPVYTIESVLEAKIWDALLDYHKDINNLQPFKRKLIVVNHNTPLAGI